MDTDRTIHGGVPSWLRVVLVAAILFGVALRLYNLPLKIYFYDEVFTSLHCAGYTLSEFLSTIDDDRPHDVAALRRYQGTPPVRPIKDVITALAAEDSQHPPLFYVADRLTTDLLGNSITARRLPAALFGILVIPAAAWLAFELFGSAFAALLGAAIVAVSPFMVLYSQQAREYSLWALVTAISSAMLLRAVRMNRLWTWLTYAALLVLGLYTFTFFLFVIAAHALYVLAQRTLWPQRVIRFGLCAVAAVTAFSPWIVVEAMSVKLIYSETSYSTRPMPATLLLAHSAFNTLSAFFDAEYGSAGATAVVPLLIIMIAAALVYLAWSSSKEQRLFLFSLILVTALPLVLDDFVAHASRTAATRYFVPELLGVQLTMAGFLSAIWMGATRPASRAFTGALIVGLLVAGAYSCGVSAQSRIWWPNSQDAGIAPLADVLHDHPGKLVLSDDPLLILKLINYSPSNDRFALAGTNVSKRIDSSAIFIAPSAAQLNLLRSSNRYVMRSLAAKVPPIDTFGKSIGSILRGPSKAIERDPAATRELALWIVVPKKRH